MNKENLDFYENDFFSNPNGDVHQRVETFASKNPGVFQFVKVFNEEDEEGEIPTEETTWLLTHERFDGQSRNLWKGNLSSQEILDAVVKKYI